VPNNQALHVMVAEAVAVLRAETGLTMHELFRDHEHRAELATPTIGYARGVIEGAAKARHATPLELLAELELL
jgi:hypothetical protein